MSIYHPVYANDSVQPQSNNEPPPNSKSTKLSQIIVTAKHIDNSLTGPIHGYVAEQSKVGTKTQTPLLEVPQSVSVVTRDLMDLQQIGTTSQAMRYTPGVVSEKYGTFGDQLDFTRIRGVDADYYLDGLRMIGNVGSWAPQIDPFTLERVEVLRGPTSVLYGQGTGGGIVNQVSRRPDESPSHEIRLQLGNYGHRFIGIDTTGPLDKDRNLLYRFTATGLNTSNQIEDTRHKRVYMSPSFTWRPSEHTSWTILAVHSYEPKIFDYNSLPADLLGLDHSKYPKLNRHRNYQDNKFSDSTRKQNSISSLFEHSFNDNWGLTNNMRYMHITSNLKRSVVYGYQLVDNHPFLKDTYEDSPSRAKTFQIDNNLHGKIRLGPITQKLLAGVDFTEGSMESYLYSNGSYLVDPYGQNYRPNIDPDFSSSHTSPWSEKQKFNRIGIYIQDQIYFGNWLLTLGARHDKSKADDWTKSYSPTAKHTKINNQKWTGRAGLSYQFNSGIAPYVSYSTAFDPIIGSGYNGNVFSPVQSKQTEIGIKFHPYDSKTLLTAALFNLEQTNVKTSDADHLGFNTQAGKVRSRGLDLSAITEIISNLNLIANYTYLSNKLLQDTTYKGKTLTQTPKHNASLWVDYLISSGSLTGLQIGAGVRYLGSSWGDPNNSFKVPAATLFDLVLNYDLGQIYYELDGSNISINATNITNKRYISSCTSAMYCFIGQNRTISATFSYRW